MTVATGAHTITETNLPTGWVLDSITCNGGGGGDDDDDKSTNTATSTPGGGSSGSVTVNDGDSFVCIVKNKKQTGSIKVIKKSVNGDGNFDFTSSNSNLAGFSLTTSAPSHEAANGPQTVPTGAYTITETPVAGWTTAVSCSGDSNGSASGNVATVNLDSGENVICTFTNTRQTGSIKVKKITVGGNGTFDYTTTGAGYSNFSITTISNAGESVTSSLVAGTYTVDEATLPAGWSFTSLSCDANSSIAGTKATITLPAGGNVTCTYTNTKKGSIIIEKKTIGGNGTFMFTTSGPGLSTFDIATANNAGSKTFDNLAPGTYTVTETAPAGWTLTDLTCSTGGSGAKPTATITLVAGATVTCTYTNTQNGTIIIEKKTVGGNGTFNFATTGAGLSNFALTTSGYFATTTFPNLVPGNFSVIETVPNGWTLTDLTCSTGGSAYKPTANITLAAGATVTCTFTNTKLAKLTIQKVSIGGVGAFMFNGSAPIGTFDLTTVAPNTAVSAVFENLATGGYTVGETPPADWILQNVSGGCSRVANTNSASITLAPGDNITCTFVNFKKHDDPMDEVTQLYVHRRVDNLLTHGPDRARLLRRVQESAEEPTGSLKDGPMKFSGNESSGLQLGTRMGLNSNANMGVGVGRTHLHEQRRSL